MQETKHRKIVWVAWCGVMVSIVVSQEPGFNPHDNRRSFSCGVCMVCSRFFPQDFARLTLWKVYNCIIIVQVQFPFTFSVWILLMCPNLCYFEKAKKRVIENAVFVVNMLPWQQTHYFLSFVSHNLKKKLLQI